MLVSIGSGGWIRTTDLRVMSPTSCHCSTPRRELRTEQGHSSILNLLLDGARTYSPSGHSARTFGAAAFHDPVRDGSGWSHDASRTPLAQGPVPTVSSRSLSLSYLTPHVFPQGSPRPCAPVASTCHHASSSGRSPCHLQGDLPVL